MDSQYYSNVNANLPEAEMTSDTKRSTPWYLWPFAAVWKLLATIVEMTGRLLAMLSWMAIGDESFVDACAWTSMAFHTSPMLPW